VAFLIDALKVVKSEILNHFEVVGTPSVQKDCMTVSSKVRIYDLAKELKLDTKRLIEEVRREGVDVSVPSNSVSKELAEKIRNKYFPKKETTIKRAVKVVKRAAMPAEPAPAADEPEVEADEPEPIAVAPEAPPEHVAPEPVVPKPLTPARLVKKLTPAARAERPAEIVAEAAVAEQGEEVELEQPEEIVDVPDTQLETPEIRSTPVAPSRQVRVLRPTAAALNAGIRPGERAPAPTPPPPVVAPTRDKADRTRVRERPSLPRAERSGTPGGTATPQTAYLPPSAG